MLKFIYFLRISVYVSGMQVPQHGSWGLQDNWLELVFSVNCGILGKTLVSMLECEHPDLLSLPTTWLCFTLFFLLTLKKISLRVVLVNLIQTKTSLERRTLD